MKNKKFQLAALAVLLVVVIAAGAWLLLRTPGQEQQAADQTVAEENAASLAYTELQYYQIVRESHEEDVPAPYDAYLIALQEMFLYDGQMCCFAYRTDPAVDIVSLLTGEVLRSYGPEEFLDAENLLSLCLDETGTLWELYSVWQEETEEEQLAAAPCKPGVTEADSVLLGTAEDLGLMYLTPPLGFAVRQDCCLFNFYGDQLLFLTSTATGERKSLAGENMYLMDFCLDEAGNLYYLTQDVEHTSDFTLWKYALETEEEVWHVPVENPWNAFFFPFSLSYTEGVGLLVRGDHTGKVYQLDTETGAILQQFADLSVDLLDPPDSVLTGNGTYAADAEGRIYYCDYHYDLSKEPKIRTRDLLAAELVTVNGGVSPADVVTLTITSPYQVDSIDKAVRKYQQTHPEVQVVWDTQYLSREEFQANTLEYKEQIALRTMTGDVGDLQMIVGAGLGTETITDTDAFADLSPYLDSCPFRDDLIWNAIEALRGEDGAIRGLPVYLDPMFFVWNMDLLEELGMPFDPDTVTWSELLDLALQWKANRTDLALTSANPEFRANTEGFLLTDLLLANLYDAEQADGTVQLDQPYLRDLLTKFEALHGSSQLVRGGGEEMNSKTLFLQLTHSQIVSQLAIVADMEANLGIQVRIAPVPKGEVSKTQQGYAFCWGIPASSTHKDAAWELLQYLISSDGIPLNYLYTEDTLPLNMALQEKWYETQAETFAMANWDGEKFLGQVQEVLSTVPFSRLDQPYGWNAAVYEPIKAYIDGETTLDEAMETANANWERFLLE